MIEIVHQKQNLPDSCVSASLAMILGKSSQQVEDEFHVSCTKDGACPYEYLRSKGVGLEFGRIDRNWMEYGKLYLVTVPSLNLVATNHMVVVDLRDGDVFRVYDPNQGREGRKIYVGLRSEADLAENEFNIGGFVVDCEITYAPWLGIGINDPVEGGSCES